MPSEPPARETIALVSCVKSKRPGPCPARDLYISPLFHYMRAYAEQHANRWFILSAKYGLVDPKDQLKTYEQTLSTATAQERRCWAERVAEQMRATGILRAGVSIVWLAGRLYQTHLSKLLADFPQQDPLVGKAIGNRLSWLKRHAKLPKR